jgi:hypothetical protein
MKVIDAPLIKDCMFTGLDGSMHTGIHIATIASDSGLSEYIITYDPTEDKIMAFHKRYMNPDEPGDYDIVGVDNPHLLNEIGYFCNKEGLFDHLPVKQDEENSDEE